MPLMVCRTRGKFLPSGGFSFLIQRLDFGIPATFTRTMVGRVWSVLTPPPGRQIEQLPGDKGQANLDSNQDMATTWLCDLGGVTVPL